MGANDTKTATVLILGGTAEARTLAERLAAEPGLRPLLSLAGATTRPAGGAAEARAGGFGGAEGLRRYLLEQSIAALIDATHPFAARMSRNAAEASRAAGVPLLRLKRPAWTPQPGDRWRMTRTAEEAAALPPAGARVFLAIGPNSAAPFASRPDLWAAIRRIEPTEALFPLAQGQWVVGRPPFPEADERRLFEELGVGWLVSKNSGGDRAKLNAARALGMEVVMIERPAPMAGLPCVETVDEAVEWALAAIRG